ncbi:MAG TPA: hypothetical protein PLI18_01380, partial [Pirellulaceae bacterium]|nr:hypothetical protein [Pirellulaceae bacterium]
MVRRQGFSTGFGAGVGFVTAIVLVVIGLPMLLVVLSCGGCLAIGLLGNAGRNAEQARSGHATASSRQYGRQLVETPEVAVGPIDGFMRYTIRIEPPDARHDGYTGIVKFLELPHRHETVSKIVRETMRQLIAQRPEATHMVMAFDAEGMAIGDFRYCGALDHKPGYPVPRRNLGEAIEHLRDDYSVVIELAKPLPNGDLGSTAMFFGFAKFPTDERIVRALQFEIRELNDQTGDVNAYVYLGTPDDRLHWSQIPTDDGNFRGMEFD